MLSETSIKQSTHKAWVTLFVIIKMSLNLSDDVCKSRELLNLK